MAGGKNKEEEEEGCDLLCHVGLGPVHPRACSSVAEGTVDPGWAYTETVEGRYGCCIGVHGLLDWVRIRYWLLGHGLLGHWLLLWHGLWR